jgi:hypothetical protein
VGGYTEYFKKRKYEKIKNALSLIWIQYHFVQPDETQAVNISPAYMWKIPRKQLLKYLGHVLMFPQKPTLASLK